MHGVRELRLPGGHARTRERGGKVCPGQCCTDKFTGAPVLPGDRRDKICVTTFPKAGTFMKVTIETG